MGEDFDNDRGFDRGNKEMHSVVCAECGQETEVPFKPDGSRPVYCRDCFQKRRGSSPRRGGGGDRGPRQMHSTVCAECGKDTEVPFKPDGSRPVYCRDCFQKRRNSF